MTKLNVIVKGQRLLNKLNVNLSVPLVQSKFGSLLKKSASAKSRRGSRKYRFGKSRQKIGKPRQTLKNTKYIHFFQNFKHIK
jgi:hypothetical protein